MERMSVSQFRLNFTKVEQPVEILRGTETIGIYYPAGTMSLASATTPTIEAVYTAPLTQTMTVPGPEVPIVAKPTVHQILSKVNTKTK